MPVQAYCVDAVLLYSLADSFAGPACEASSTLSDRHMRFPYRDELMISQRCGAQNDGEER